ncbi:hypothetical protein FACS1894216_07150 [Synergistales bacterium]|nr:hypothetical protein FACS1894216_07150 [Synergistales bacterium]
MPPLKNKLKLNMYWLTGKPSRDSKMRGILAAAASSPYPYLLIISMIAAFAICSLLSGIALRGAMEVESQFASVVARLPVKLFTESGQTAATASAISFTAFGVQQNDPKLAEGAEASSVPEISSFSLHGTLPRVGAWISSEKGKEPNLVLRLQEFGGYVLETVDANSVSLSRDGKDYTLYLNMGGSAAPQTAQNPPPRAAPSQNQAITAAVFNGGDGAITRESVNSLVQNPYGELAKMRLIPQEGGMKVERIAPDSLLGQLGVKAGDVIVGINGINMNNAQDMGNVINSMMSAARFDVNLKRDSGEGKLGYAVK